MARRAIVLDCDPGIDDAIAILLALASPEEILLRAITCVVGNVPLEQTARNARRVVTLAGRGDVAIHAGCPRPLMGDFVRDPVHGEDGLGGVALPEPQVGLAKGHGVDVMIETLMEAPEGEVTLCPTGPMTNVALAMVKEPRIIPRIREVVFMGGAAFKPGNVTPAAEFNVLSDPQAAQIVVSSGVPLVMLGLDVTQKAPATAERIAALGRAGGPVCQAAAAMLVAYGRDTKYLHDPCVIAYLIRPELFQGVAGRLEVDCSPGLNYGRTVCFTGAQEVADAQHIARVMTGIDADGYFALITERLARYG